MALIVDRPTPGFELESSAVGTPGF
jgi:hypothetical protein